MSVVVLPIVFAIFIWWFSTGLILLADRLPSLSVRLTLIATTAMAAIAVTLLAATAGSTTLVSAYTSFFAGIILWGWHEVTFLSGAITGPRRTPLPAGVVGWRRFIMASQTLIWHEIAIALTAIVLMAAMWNAPNQVGLWVFLVLWGMRLSTKFNILLGVPNVTAELLPERLSHLKTYFRHRPLNYLFPFSATAATSLALWLAHEGLSAGATPFETTAFLLTASLAALGMLEHWFLVLPLRDAQLWKWYLSRSATTPSLPSSIPAVQGVRVQEPSPPKKHKATGAIQPTGAALAPNAIGGHRR